MTVANDVGALVYRRAHRTPSDGPGHQPQQDLGGADRRGPRLDPGVHRHRGDIHPWTPANAAVLGVVVAVVAPIGDLCESLFKRDLELKDMGTLPRVTAGCWTGSTRSCSRSRLPTTWFVP